MLRVDLKNLGFDSVNKYAVGEGEYSNTIKLFSIMTGARLHSEIANLPLNIPRKPDRAVTQKWNDLYTILKELNGIGGVANG